MANFDPPFSALEEKRFPTSDERRNGFECGPADMLLFNGLFHRLEAEVGEVINHAGIAQADTDFTQLRKAIMALIASSLPVQEDDPEVDVTQFVLMSQARARLPFYPEIETFDGRMPVIQSGTGNVSIPGGVTFTHRGIFPITTEVKNFPTMASKIYHLRWNKNEGFVLKDLADTVSYNPGQLPETAMAFDTAYDDMLIARVITNSSNIANITTLANKATLSGEFYNEFTFPSLNPGSVSDHLLGSPIEINWSRKPIVSLAEIGCNAVGVSLAGAIDFGVTGNGPYQFERTKTTRYNSRTALQAMNSGTATGTITAQWQITARA